MLPSRILITGATGFVGSRVCEVMALTKTFRPRALVHSAGSASRVARLPIDFVLGDLCDRRQVHEAVKGCDAVVHLARGTDGVMSRGLENVLAAAHAHGVQRFVHVSSVAVYGDRPTPESRTEAATPRPGANAYGRDKLAQEARVLRYARRFGLPTVILRPPYVYGPYAHFTVSLINRLRDGTLPMVDGGQNPCNLVYVDNLVQAILLSLSQTGAAYEVFFITDKGAVTWEQCLEDHAKLVGRPVARVTRAQLPPSSRSRPLIDSLRATPRVLLSGEFRAALRQIPLVESADTFAWNRFDALPEEFKERIRLRIQGPREVAKAGGVVGRLDPADNLLLAQGRTVTHSSEKASRLMNYDAPISYAEGMRLTEAWLGSARFIA